MAAPTRRLSLSDLDLAGRRVFVRADFNVPLHEGAVADDTRIRAALPTLQRILEAGGSLVIASHLGRPKGEPDPKLSLAPVAEHLSGLLEREVALAPDCRSSETASLAGSLQSGEVLLLENLRFHPEEKKNDEDFALRLASFADEYVNDAFGTCHRAHASVSALPGCFDRPAAGLLVEREIEALGRILGGADAPFAAVLGGAKVSDKLPVIESLLPRIDLLLIGGAMAHTFLLAGGHPVGTSLVEPDLVGTVKELLAAAETQGVRVLTPIDYVVAASKDQPEGARTISRNEFAEGDCGVDVGEETRAAYADALASCKTILWNGPMGVFETPPFDAGTRAVAEAVAKAAAFSVVGGGDSVAALNALDLADRVSHVSTGGGAMLELISGKELPGLLALAAAETA